MRCLAACLSAFSLTCLPLAGCAPPPPVPQTTCPHIPDSPPARRPDPLPPVSAGRLTLQPGHWNWVDGGYVWEAPAWVPSATPHPHWLAGFWTPNGGGCAWTPGQFLP